MTSVLGESQSFLSRPIGFKDIWLQRMLFTFNDYYLNGPFSGRFVPLEGCAVDF